MIASVSTIRGAGGPLQEEGALTENTRLAGEAMEQWLHEFEGYLGALFLADEDGRTVRALTFWETAEDATRSQAARMAMRDDMAAHAGMTAEKTETYAVAFSDVKTLLS